MFLVGDNREIITVLRKPRSEWYVVCCFGRKRHYRKDGTCKHTDDVLANVKPEYAGRVKVEPWGGKRPAVQT